MVDVFYYGTKPNLFVFEQVAVSIEDAANKSKTEYFWFLHGDNNYDNFDFEWQPAPWDRQYISVFPSQWQKNGFVYLCNKNYIKEKHFKFYNHQTVIRKSNRSNWIIPDYLNLDNFDFSWHPNYLEDNYSYHFSSNCQEQSGLVYMGGAETKIVDNICVRSKVVDIYYIDFLNKGSDAQFDKLKETYGHVYKTRYVDNYLNVLKRVVHKTNSEYVWVISSICDYNNFDFTWHPNFYQKEMIHVFPSGNQIRGDTFYIHVPTFKQQMVELEILEWFNVINYCSDQTVSRMPAPIVRHNKDNLISELHKYEFEFPYAIFTTLDVNLSLTPCLWANKDKEIIRLSKSGAVSLIPKEVKSFVKTQIYDYPYIQKRLLCFDYFGDKGLPELDIFYVSNGEPNEYENYKLLLTRTRRMINWVHGVDNRSAALKLAAKKSSTPWFYVVPAKLEINDKFDWSWMPDYYQMPKHYIFTAQNPVNELVYGHMAMVAYNKNLVLETDTPGLDFTLSKPHESVLQLSGIAHFNQDPVTTWRTAFRETVKLKHYNTTKPTVETEYRLNTWLTKAQGNFAEWSLKGARDAIEYYDQVRGELSALELSYTWQWTDNYFKEKGYNK